MVNHIIYIIVLINKNVFIKNKIWILKSHLQLMFFKSKIEPNFFTDISFRKLFEQYIELHLDI